MKPDRPVTPITIDGSNKRFIHFILDAINSGILILDNEERIIFSNSKATSLLASEGTLVGRKFNELFPPADRKILGPNLIKIAKAQGEFDGDVMLRGTDKNDFVARLAIASWKEEGNYTHVVSISDLSRLKEIEKLLRGSERMIYLGQMLDDISHQIRNPVLAIGGFARRLLKAKKNEPEYVKVILEEAGRLERLLDVLTQFIRLPRPRFSLQKVENVFDLMDDLARDLCKKMNIKVEISALHPSDKVVATDLTLLRKAIEPVLINACEACKEMEDQRKGFVSVGFEQPEKSSKALRITVSDSGIGIRPPFMQRIFYPFFTTKTGHVGMGLTFTKRITEELEADIHVESALGKGTKVTVELPGDRRKKIRTRPL